MRDASRWRNAWKAIGFALIVVGLPCAGTWSRRHRLPRCALDGAAIEPVYAVELVDAEGQRRSFCCILCAEYWLARQPEPMREVRVIDEVSVEPLQAEQAVFVRSPIVTNAATGNRIHVFRERAEAEGHIAAYGGRILTPSERPFVADRRDGGDSRSER